MSVCSCSTMSPKYINDYDMMFEYQYEYAMQYGVNVNVSTNWPRLAATSAARGCDPTPNSERFRVAIRRGAAGDA